MLFNVFGWILVPLRVFHLWMMGATLGSWLVLGWSYGFGYCPITDWHWQVKSQLDPSPLPSSYIQYLFDQVFGMNIDKLTANWLAGFGLLVGVSGAAWVRRQRFLPPRSST